MIRPMGRLVPVLGVCAILGAACKSDAPRDTDPSDRGSVGARPISSLAASAWPCRSVESTGSAEVYDYTDAPRTCWFPPDLWLPGCATRVDGRTYRYDARGRLVEIAAKTDLMAVPSISYDGDRVISAGSGKEKHLYYSKAGATHMYFESGKLFGVVDHGDAGIARIRTGIRSAGDQVAVTDEQFEYRAGRLVLMRSGLLGLGSVSVRYEYDCR
jgi:hypothetical protein